MRLFLYRLAGSTFILGAVFGLILTVCGIYYLWRGKASTTTQITNFVNLTSRSLHTVDENLTVVDSSLAKAQDNLVSIQTSTVNLAKTIEQTGPAVDSVSTLVGSDLPGIVNNTRKSLAAAQEGAKLVDDTLRVISAIPLIGGRYKPAVPLQQTVQDVSNSLKDLPDSLSKVQKSIQTANGNLQEIKTGVDQVSSELDQFGSNLVDARDAVHKDQVTIKELIAQVDALQGRLPNLLRGFYIIATTILVWLILVQVSLFMHGLEYLGKE